MVISSRTTAAGVSSVMPGARSLLRRCVCSPADASARRVDRSVAARSGQVRLCGLRAEPPSADETGVRYRGSELAAISNIYRPLVSSPSQDSQQAKRSRREAPRKAQEVVHGEPSRVEREPLGDKVHLFSRARGPLDASSFKKIYMKI